MASKTRGRPGAHNDKAFQDRLTALFSGELETQLKNGLAQGVFAACKVVRDYATDETLEPDQRLAKITEFCDVVVKPALEKAETK